MRKLRSCARVFASSTVSRCWIRLAPAYHGVFTDGAEVILSPLKPEIGMAVNNRRKDQAGNWVDEAVFVDVTLWGRTAEVAQQYLSKGSPVFIEGRLKLDQWEQDGKKRSKLRVVGEKLQLIGSKGGGGGNNAAPQESEPSGVEAPADDIPF